MTQGESLFSAILKEDNPSLLFRIKPEWLETTSEKILFKFLKEYVQEHQKLPGMKSASMKYPQLKAVTANSTFYLKEVSERHIYTELLTKLPNIVKNLKDDPTGKLDVLRTLVASLHAPQNTRDANYHEGAVDRLERYHAKKGTGGITYLSTGDEVLDRIIYGYHRNDLTTIGGRAGTKKTWMMCYLAMLVDEVIPETDGPVLFITNEISEEEIQERMDCIKFRLGVERFNRGELTAIEEGRYSKGAKTMARMKRSRIKVIFNCNTLDALEEKILIYQPSIVFVDGSYLLEPKMEEGMNKTTFITRNLKGLAMNSSIPLINTTQLRKKAGKGKYANSLDGQDEFYYGSYVQDSDFAIRTFIDEDMIYHNKIGWDFVKARRVPPNTVVELEANLDTMFFKFNYDLSHATKAASEDDESIEF